MEKESAIHHGFVLFLARAALRESALPRPVGGGGASIDPVTFITKS
jgi:hypothetical protein